MSMKNSNNTIGNRTRDLPACRAVPQLTAPSRTTEMIGVDKNCTIIHFILSNVVQKLCTGRVNDLKQQTCRQT
jgi:hypothetical protein